MNQPDPAEIEAAAKSVREYLDFTAQIGGDILFSYRGVELRKADVETLLAALATAEERAENAEKVLRRLDWSNIHTHYGVTSTCADCNFYAILTQAQANYHKATWPQAENEEGS